MNTALAATGIFTACMSLWYGLPWAYRAVTRELARAPRRARTIAPRAAEAHGRHRDQHQPDAQPAARYLFQLNRAADTAQQAMAAAIHAEEGR